MLEPQRTGGIAGTEPSDVCVFLDAVCAVPLCRFDFSGVADADQMDTVLGLARIRSVLDVAQAELLAGLERTQLATVETGHTTARWLSANEAGMSHGSAKARCECGPQTPQPFRCRVHRVRRWPYLLCARESDRRRRVPRIIDQLVAIQDQLVVLAENVDRFERFSRELQSIVNLLDQDGAFDPSGETKRNRLVFRFDPDGVRVDGMLVGAIRGGGERSTQSDRRRTV